MSGENRSASRAAGDRRSESKSTSRLESRGFVVAYVVVSSALVVAAFAALLYATDRPEIRFFGQYQGHYSAIYDQTEPVDVAFGGSSRTRRGAFRPYLEESLAPYFGDRPPSVYNLAVAGNGMDAQIKVLTELLQRRKVRYAFLQVYQLRDNKFPTHRNLQKVGTLEDILFTPMDGFWWVEVATHRMRLLYLRVSEMIDNCLSDLTVCRKGPEGGAHVAWHQPREVDVERQKKFLRARDKKRSGEYFKYQPRSWDFESGRNARSAYYLDRLVELARARGTTVVFVDFAKFEWDTLADGFPEYVQKRFGVDYLYLGTDELRELGEGGGYGDYGHVNLRGEPVLRRMVVDYFKRRTAESSDGSTVAHSSRGRDERRQ